MREVPDAPRLSDLISLQRLSEMLPLLVYGVGEMTRPLAGAVIVKALLGLDQWAGKPPSALPLYICQSTGACLMDAEEKEPLDRDVREWEFDRKMWGEGHELVGRYPPNRPSDRAEALLYLGRHHGQELKEARLSGRWNEYPGDMLAVVREDAFKAFGMASFLEQPPPDPAAAAVQSEPAPAPAADSAVVDQQRSGPDLEHIAAVYLREVGIRQHGAINRAAAKLKRLDGKPMGRTTLVKRLKEANEAGIHTGYQPER